MKHIIRKMTGSGMALGLAMFMGWSITANAGIAPPMDVWAGYKINTLNGRAMFGGGDKEGFDKKDVRDGLAGEGVTKQDSLYAFVNCSDQGTIWVGVWNREMMQIPFGSTLSPVFQQENVTDNTGNKDNKIADIAIFESFDVLTGINDHAYMTAEYVSKRLKNKQIPDGAVGPVNCPVRFSLIGFTGYILDTAAILTQLNVDFKGPEMTWAGPPPGFNQEF